MGKDFTPREHHAADLQYGFSKSDFAHRQSNGLDRDYPNLAYLLGAHHMAGIPARTLSVFERILTQVVNDSDAGKTFEKYADNQFETVRKWYIGELDPYFYYDATNNELLRIFMLEETKNRRVL